MIIHCNLLTELIL